MKKKSSFSIIGLVVLAWVVMPFVSSAPRPLLHLPQPVQRR